MNGPFVVAQANSTSSVTPVQVIKLFKPTAGHTEIFHASFSGLVKIDFSAIANEKITLFHDSKNQSLHIIFADGSQDIIEPFFNSRGIMSNLLLDMGSGQEFNGERFASQFPITEDQSVLPAADPGGVASGADFHGPFVDGLFTGNPLDLLPPEELPGLQFTITATPLLTENSFVPFTFGNLNGLVEEEELRFQVQQEERPVNNVANGDGNEDNNDKSNNDADNLPTDNTTNIITGDFSTIVHGGVGGPLTFVANAGANGHAVFAADGVTQITSIGEKVVYQLHGANEIWGVTVPQHEGESERTIFILHIEFEWPVHVHADRPDRSPAAQPRQLLDKSAAPAGDFRRELWISISPSRSVATTPRTTSSSCRRANSTSASSTTRRSLSMARTKTSLLTRTISTPILARHQPERRQRRWLLHRQPGRQSPGPGHCVRRSLRPRESRRRRG